MGLLSKDAILSAQDRPFVDTEVPEWGGTVRISAMSGFARDQFDRSLVKVDPDGKRSVDLANYYAKALSGCIVDEDGNRVFDSHEVAELGKKNAGVLKRLFEIADDLNSFTQKDVEEKAKNS